VLTLDVHDAKRLVDLAPRQPAADGHDDLAAALILLDVELDHALLACDCLERANVNLAQ
jgi:hypothetical protein